MTQYDVDLFVIGAGSGGVRASRMSARLGARVAIAEEYRAGGTCVIRGCVPKKLLTYAAHFHEDFEDARGYGWSVPEATFSWPALIAAKDREIARLEAIYEKLLVDAGVEIIKGRARLVDAHAVEVAGRRVTAAHVLVATGGWPVRPEIPGAELAITSNEALDLPALPQRVLVVGGGYIAVEFAGIFNGLGSQVTLSYRGEEILRGFDHDVRRHLREQIGTKGIRVERNHQVRSIARGARGLSVATSSGTIECDAVMFATGRSPNAAGMGLEAAGVKLDAAGAVAVDAYSRSSVAHIFAVGDVTNRIALTPVAIREGSAVAQTLFGGQPTPVAHDNVPCAVFSQPPVSVVGLTEADAIAKYGEIEVYQSA